VEASYEDDLWGAFELEEIPESAAAEPVAAEGWQADAEFEAEEFFSFEDDSDAIEETGPALDLPAAQQQSAEELFSFAQEPPEAAAPATQPEAFDFPVEEPFSFDAEVEIPAAPFAAAAAPAPPQQPSVAAFQAEAPRATAPAPAGYALSEADLIAALSKISREVIERIVWEVVPDLAEVLIKEEIRKLKAGIKG